MKTRKNTMMKMKMNKWYKLVQQDIVYHHDATVSTVPRVPKHPEQRKKIKNVLYNPKHRHGREPERIYILEEVEKKNMAPEYTRTGPSWDGLAKHGHSQFRWRRGP